MDREANNGWHWGIIFISPQNTVVDASEYLFKNYPELCKDIQDVMLNPGEECYKNNKTKIKKLNQNFIRYYGNRL